MISKLVEFDYLLFLSNNVYVERKINRSLCKNALSVVEYPKFVEKRRWIQVLG